MIIFVFCNNVWRFDRKTTKSINCISCMNRWVTLYCTKCITLWFDLNNYKYYAMKFITYDWPCKTFGKFSTFGPCETLHVKQFSFSIAKIAIICKFTTCDKCFTAIITNLLLTMPVLWSSSITEYFSVKTLILNKIFCRDIYV